MTIETPKSKQKLQQELEEAQSKIDSAIDTLERWQGGYQDKIIKAVKILRGKDPVQVENKALFSMIAERPDPTLDWNNPFCPSCGSTNLEDHGGEHTCIGWFPRVPEDNTPDCPGNPNLSSCHYSCNECNYEFMYLVKYGNIWVDELITKVGGPVKLLNGIPNTSRSKNFRYTCAHCGERDVKIEDAEKKYKHIIAPPEEENLPYKIICESCGVSVESLFDCYQHPHTYKNAFHGIKGPIKLSYKEGVTIANSRAIQKGLPKGEI